ncbi:MAG: hypothetical protein KAT05_05390 [Spirochaetes bacterium]|nr:hypothetical protein [Spirochaetota bacterium]
MKKFILIIFNLFLCIFIFSAETIEAPFVSKLTFEVSNEKVLLKWQNPVDFDQHLTIYRSNTVINSTQKLLNAKSIALLKQKNEKYIDTPPNYGNHYYAVIITNKSSNEDNIVLVPFRNYTQKPSVIVKRKCFEITKFSANLKKISIALEWQYKTDSESTKKIMIYRNTEPIKSNDVLMTSIKIGTLDIKAKLYVDVPISNIDYYYAIFVEGDIEKTFIPDVNISTNPVAIVKSNETFPDFSINNFIPLPLLAIKNDPKSGKYFLDPQILKNPKKIDYTDNVKKIINNYRLQFNNVFTDFMKNKQKDLQYLGFHILNNEDIYVPEEYKLEYNNAISYIKNKKYNLALNILEEIINEILPDDLLQRVSYYVGLIYYTKSDFYMSYVYLILAYDSYRKEVLPYLESIYLKIFEKLER